MTTKHPYGEGFAKSISKRRAIELCGAISAPAPRTGYETCIREVPDSFGAFYRLHVQNIGGEYFLTSHNVERPMWVRLFNVDGVGK